MGLFRGILQTSNSDCLGDHACLLLVFLINMLSIRGSFYNASMFAPLWQLCITVSESIVTQLNLQLNLISVIQSACDGINDHCIIINTLFSPSIIKGFHLVIKVISGVSAHPHLMTFDNFHWLYLLLYWCVCCPKSVFLLDKFYLNQQINQCYHE